MRGAARGAVCAWANAPLDELLLETVATAAFGTMQENPSLSLVCFSDADNFDFCNCEACVEISEKYGFKTCAIVTMKEVIEHLYNRPYKGKVIIDDTLMAAINAYYEQYGAK